jgi:hypothetical protein
MPPVFLSKKLGKVRASHLPPGILLGWTAQRFETAAIAHSGAETKLDSRAECRPSDGPHRAVTSYPALARAFEPVATTLSWRPFAEIVESQAIDISAE